MSIFNINQRITVIMLILQDRILNDIENEAQIKSDVKKWYPVRWIYCPVDMPQIKELIAQFDFNF